MTALYVILIIVGIILLLLMIPLNINISYGESPRVSVRYFFLRFRIFPTPEKKKKTPSKAQKKEEKTEEKSEEKSPEKKNLIKDLKKKHGLQGLIELVYEMAAIVGNVLGRFGKHLLINRFDLNLLVVGEDSADTAVKYGIVCSVIYPAIAYLESNAKLKKHREDIAAGFLAEKTVCELDVRASIRPLFLVGIAFSALIRGIKVIMKYK